MSFLFSVCSDCGAGYNVAMIRNGEFDMPPLLPRVEGICDSCGGSSIVQRSDDKVEVVKER